MPWTKSLRTVNILIFAMVILFLIALISDFTLGQDLKTAIFSDATKAMKEAQNVNANILAPKAFSEGLELYQKAVIDYKKEKNLVEKSAPKTLQKAKKIVKEAEKELSENRYDTDMARDLAKQAKYEANHSLYLSSLIKKMKDEKKTWEDLLLESEVPLKRISEPIDLVPSFDNGLLQPTDDIIKAIKNYQKSISELNSSLYDTNQQIELLKQRTAELKKKNAELRSKLGGIETEKSALEKRLEIQAKIRERYAAATNLFNPNEAIVLRKGNDLIFRLIGLSFPVGKANIDPKFYEYLSKIQQVINLFPNAKITITGHTDSYGSDEVNLNLSRDRAGAVKNYLLERMTIDPLKVASVGYGENKPIATNETEEGRAKNRRIEVVIHPNLGESL